MRSATRLLVVTLLGVLVALSAVSVAVAEPDSAERDNGLVVQTTTPPPPATTVPSVDIERPESEEDRKETQRKLVMGIVSAVLVGIVIWGRSVRRKRKKASEGG